MAVLNGFAQEKKIHAHPKHGATVYYGTASFYANKFEGRRMANGEIFHQKTMTAASNRFKLETWVKVTNLKNKRFVTVRITDRMNHTNKRLIDLSRTAASRLKYTGHGLAHVRVEILPKKPAGDLADEK
jgi:rare lipoprotein A